MCVCIFASVYGTTSFLHLATVTPPEVLFKDPNFIHHVTLSPPGGGGRDKISLQGETEGVMVNRCDIIKFTGGLTQRLLLPVVLTSTTSGSRSPRSIHARDPQRKTLSSGTNRCENNGKATRVAAVTYAVDPSRTQNPTNERTYLDKVQKRVLPAVDLVVRERTGVDVLRVADVRNRRTTPRIGAISHKRTAGERS